VRAEHRVAGFCRRSVTDSPVPVSRRFPTSVLVVCVTSNILGVKHLILSGGGGGGVNFPVIESSRVYTC
jgi:hypothetical protein